MQARSRARGFTLLEMLVMLIVIGITISFVTLSIGVGGRPVELKNEAEKLTGMLQLALEEAVLTGKPIGLRIDETLDRRGTQFSYEWSVLEQGQWQPFEQHPVLQDGQVTEGIELDLTLEGVEIKLQDEREEDDDSTLKETYQPDILFCKAASYRLLSCKLAILNCRVRCTRLTAILPGRCACCARATTMTLMKKSEEGQ